MTRYAHPRNVRAGVLTEAVEGIREDSAPYETTITTGLGVEFTSEKVISERISGSGRTLGVRTNLRGLNLTWPMELVYADVLRLVSQALRRDVKSQAEVDVVLATTEANVILGGTGADGLPADQITAPDLAFDSLITYAGATPTTHPFGGIEGFMIDVSGFTGGAAVNNGLRRVRAVHNPGSVATIDFYDGYTGGVVGGFGEPMFGVVAETGAVTIRVGRAGADDSCSPNVFDTSYSALWNFCDMGNVAAWQSGFGLIGNNIVLAWTGKGAVTVEVDQMGFGSDELVSADPTGQGFTPLAPGGLDPQMIAAQDLQILALVTASKPIVLTKFNVTGFSHTLNGNVEVAADVSGTDKVTGMVRGDHAGDGTIDWRLANAVTTEELTALGSSAGTEPFGVDIIFKDPLGQQIIIGILKNEADPTGPNPGGETNGQLVFTSYEKTPSAGMYNWQEISALP